MTIQHLGRGEPTINDATTKEQKWNYYIQSYTMVTPTEGVDTDSENYKVPFLKRNLNITSSGTTASASTRDQESSDAILGPSGARTPREPALDIRQPGSPTTARLTAAVAEGCVFSRHNLEIKVCVNTYKIFYKQGTEDFMVGKGWNNRKREAREQARRERRAGKWRDHLEKGAKWMEGMKEDDIDKIKSVWAEWVKTGGIPVGGEGEDVDVVMG